MAGVQTSALAVAVSNAGGLGSLPCAMLTLDSLRAELRAITAQTTRPYNVNFFCHTPPVPDAQQDADWRAALAPYYEAFGLDVGAIEYIHRQLVAQRDAGRGVLLVSLELDEVMNVADRILVMYEGEIVGEFDPQKVTVQELGLYMAGAKREADGK